MEWLGGVERLVEVVEEVALLGGAGLEGVGGEVQGHGVVEEQVAFRHVLAEGALHHAGVDEVFAEGGGDGAIRSWHPRCFGCGIWEGRSRHA